MNEYLLLNSQNKVTDITISESAKEEFKLIMDWTEEQFNEKTITVEKYSFSEEFPSLKNQIVYAEEHNKKQGPAIWKDAVEENCFDKRIVLNAINKVFYCTCSNEQDSCPKVKFKNKLIEELGL